MFSEIREIREYLDEESISNAELFIKLFRVLTSNKEKESMFKIQTFRMIAYKQLQGDYEVMYRQIKKELDELKNELA